MSKFKIGDKVVYNKGQEDQDVGIIVEAQLDPNCFFEGFAWWIVWESDCGKQWTTEEHLTLFQPQDSYLKISKEDAEFILTELEKHDKVLTALLRKSLIN